MAPDLGVVSVPTEENSMPEVSDMTAIPSAPVPVMPEVGTVSTMVKPDLMAPAGTIQNLTAAAPDLMAPNTIGNTTIEKMSAPIGPTRPSELPVQNNIGGKDPISTPEFNPFAQTPMNFVPNNQNNSQE